MGISQTNEDSSSESSIGVILDGALDAGVLVEPGGYILEWNQQAVVTFGWLRSDARGRDFASHCVAEADRNRFSARIDAARSQASAHRVDDCVVLTLRRKTGEEFPAMFRITPTQFNGSDAALFFIRDMSEHFARDHDLVCQTLEKELLLQAATLTTEQDSLEEALRICASCLCRVTGWPVGHVTLLSDTENHSKSNGIWHLADAAFEQLFQSLKQACAVPRKEFARQILESRSLLSTSDLLKESGSDAKQPQSKVRPRAAFGFPVCVSDTIVAIMQFFSTESSALDPQSSRLVRSISGELGRMLQHRRQQQQQTRHAAIVNSSSDAIIGRSLEGDITSWNAGAALMYGYSAEEAAAGGMQLILPHDLVHQDRQILEAIRSGAQVDRIETRRVRRDGVEVHVSVTMSPVLDARGNILGGSAIERDITDLVRTQKELREREEHIRLLLNSTAEAIYGIDSNGNCTFCNQACVKMLGYDSPDDLLGCNVHGLIHHTHPDGTSYEKEDCHIYNAIRQNRETHIDDEVLWRRDGTSFPAEYWSYPIVNRGKITGAVVTFLDISERVQAEEGKARLASVVNSSVDAIIATDPAGTITNWNRGAELIYGYSAKEAIGNSLSMVMPPDHALDTSVVLDAIRNREELLQYETTRAKKDGEIIDVAITLSPIQTTDGRHVGASSIERDITARRRREQELEEARDAAEAANRTRSEFLANVSHELRTPMNAIIGMTDLALREDLPGEVRDCLTTARDSADTLLFLLNDILDYSRMEAGRFELDATDFNLRDMVHDTVKSLSLRAHEKGLELACHINLDVPYWVTGDPLRLRQVITNLVTNALKFTERGEVLVRIGLEEELPIRDPGTTFSLHVAVVDTGIGISQEDQQRIFSPFTQADASTTRRYQGTGLGLSICRRLTRLMNGRMWVESEPDVGSTFHFTACLTVAAEGDNEVAREHEAAQQLRDLPVLIVDDNLTNRRILTEMLRNWSMQPFAYADADEAMKQLDHAAGLGTPFQLIIVDALMPDVDGFMLIERIQAQQALKRATILMLSSADRQIFKERCSTLPVTAYLEKPVSQSDLLDAIVTALDGPRLFPRAEETIGLTDQPLKILVAEDTPANQKVIQRILSKRGHRIEIAHNGREAVERTERDPFDLVIMDVQMPTMDGLQATATIRAREQSSDQHTPIVAMTAHAMRGDREKCLDAGMDNYLSKPIDANKLIRLVESFGTSTSEGTSQMETDSSNDDDVDSRNQPPGQTADPASQPENKVWDLEAAMKRLGNDPELLHDLIDFFTEDAPTLLSTVESSLKSGDSADAARAAHSLKGLCSSFEAVAATTVAERIQDLAQEGNLEEARRHWSQLEEEINRLQRHLALWQTEHS